MVARRSVRSVTSEPRRARERPRYIAIADAIHARQELLDTINSAKALAMLYVGDRVRFNRHTRPQYLRGVEGIVIDADRFRRDWP